MTFARRLSIKDICILLQKGISRRFKRLFESGVP